MEELVSNQFAECNLRVGQCYKFYDLIKEEDEKEINIKIKTEEEVEKEKEKEKEIKINKKKIRRKI